MIPLSDLKLTRLAAGKAIAAIETNWVSGTGPMIREFEAALAHQVGRGNCVAVTNGTVALELVLLALGIGPGDTVIVPALTFAAPAAAVCAVGAEPIFADIHPDHWTLDPVEVDRAIMKRRWRSNRPAAIIAVDLLGHPCDWDRLLDRSRIFDIPIIEDAAEAHGAVHLPHNRQAGSFGVISTFSFHANKTIPIGEGGAVLTDNQELAERMRLIANHGMSPERPYWHEVIGHNYRMTNVTAAIGAGQVANWDTLVAERNQVADLYRHHLEGVPIQRRPVAPWAKEGVWLYTVASPHRDEYIKALRDAEIDARAIWPALPDLPAYQQYVGDNQYPVARRVAAEAFWLPTFASLQESDIARIANIIREVSHVHEPAAG